MNLQKFLGLLPKLFLTLEAEGHVAQVEEATLNGQRVPTWYVTLHGGQLVRIVASVEESTVRHEDIETSLGITPCDIEPGLAPILRLRQGRVESVARPESPQ